MRRRANFPFTKSSRARMRNIIRIVSTDIQNSEPVEPIYWIGYRNRDISNSWNSCYFGELCKSFYGTIDKLVWFVFLIAKLTSYLVFEKIENSIQSEISMIIQNMSFQFNRSWVSIFAKSTLINFSIRIFFTIKFFMYRSILCRTV